MPTRLKYGVVALVLAGCIGPEGAPRMAKRGEDASAAATKQRAQTALARCIQQNDANDHDAARKAVEHVLGDAHVLDVDTQAALLDCRASAAFMDSDDDSSLLLEAAVRAWERAPTQSTQLAHALNLYGRSLALIDVDMARAEPQYRRVLELAAKGQASAAELGRALFALYDLLDQECRTAEAEAVLARLEQVYRDRPAEVGEYPGVTQRFRAMLARRRGDLELAATTLEGLLSQVDPAKADATYYDSLFELLAEYQREGGRYVDALRALERGSRSRRPGRRGAELELAFVYEAAGDVRLEELQRQNYLVHAVAGKRLFPADVGRIAACKPDKIDAPVGWLYRDNDAADAIAACVKTATTKPSPQALLQLIMRVEDGKVVASGVHAKSFEPAVAQCVADGALGLQYPAPQDFNFREQTYWPAED